MKKMKLKLLVIAVCCMAFPLQLFAAAPANVVSVDEGNEQPFSECVIQMDDLTMPPALASIQPLFVRHVSTNGGNLNVRDYPGLSGNIIGSLPNGTAVDVSYATPTGWTFINAPIAGFVSSQYLK